MPNSQPPPLIVEIWKLVGTYIGVTSVSHSLYFFSTSTEIIPISSDNFLFFFAKKADFKIFKQINGKL